MTPYPELYLHYKAVPPVLIVINLTNLWIKISHSPILKYNNK
ncbi:Uncharacterised protein [Legionella pneumophila subsp. pascullei]|uniref:Uncharacterized protein n=1 Tax=Legionella pneumophila subsp. pascullei TaxID=91890 RepID=A0AAX2IXC0_LEGPN|nr:Uncharacterised protein [Legionella pneumophila subsp. pascullei]VEH07562.1 Uncharacterised protein [Legionella pneumophila subsp. pascullei]